MKIIKKIVIPLVILLGLGFILFLFNQVSGLYFFLRDFDPGIARTATLLLSILLAGLLLTPILVLLRLPAPIKKPKSEKELARYKSQLTRRLQSNRLLQAQKLLPANEKGLEVALDFLNSEADKSIRNTATTVFLTTSISQNGKLDALTVFATQMKMIWEIAHIYYQRPTLRELLSVYSHVGVNAFVASAIEELDITQQIEPVAGAIFKNASGKAIPLIGPSATIIMDSLLEGSTNAFLTLRVGIIARKYCGQLDVWERKKVKKSTYRESAVLLKSIALSASGKIIQGVLSATKNAGLDSLKTSWEGMKNAGERVKTEITERGQKFVSFAKKKNPAIPEGESEKTD